MEHYVTLFDSLFLPQGMSLHRSMERHVKDYLLWVLCVDQEVHDVLTALRLPNVKLLNLSEIETKELKRVKPTRTAGEYCWTLTPFTPRFVFEADSTVARVTYIDADLWFRKHPAPIYRELEGSGKGVLITDHAYAADYDASAVSGQYCVQFMPFTRQRGERVRRSWEEQCIEWCFARSEGGKLGDQKYLDAWPEAFPEDVHVLRDKELALGPWNATRFPYGNGVFFHFQGLRLTSERSVNTGGYPLPKPLIENVYKPYFLDLSDAISHLKSIGVPFKVQAPPLGILRWFYRRLKPPYMFARTMMPSGSMSW